MARDLVLDVVARKQSNDLRLLADEFDKLAKQTDDAGKSMHQTTTFSKFLEEQIAKTKVQVKEFREEANKTGSVEIFGKLDSAERNLKSLKKSLSKSLGDAGTEGGDLFSQGFLHGLGQIALKASPALAPMAVLLASELLAGVGGAITAAGGLAAIVGGAVTQIKTNPEVQGAAKDFGAWFVEQWKLDTDAFAGPTRDAISLLKVELRGPMSDLRKDFEVIAPYTRDFANSLGVAAQKFMPGLNKLLQGSGPLIQEAGHDLEMLAEAGSRFLADISDGEKGEAEALDALVHGLAQLIEFTGGAIDVSAHLWDAYVQGTRAAVDWTDKWLGKWTLFGPLLSATGAKDYLDGLGGSADDAGSKLGEMLPPMSSITREAERQKAAVDGLTKSWDTWYGVSIGVDQALLSLHQNETALTDSIAQNGRHWDLNTKAGQANYSALLQSIQAAHDYRDAQIASGVSTEQANAEYKKTIDWLFGVAGKANLSAGQIQSLRAQVGGLIGALNSLDGKVVHYSVIGTTKGPKGESGYYQGLATGGRVPGYAMGGGVIEVGEQGPEYLSLSPGAGPAYVTPNSAINGAANSSAAQEQVLRVILQYPDGQVVAEKLVAYGRATNRRTFDTLIPVGSSR